MIKEISLRLRPSEASNHDLLLKAVAEKLKIKAIDINDLHIIRRSIDARQKNIIVNLTILVALENDLTVTIQKVNPNYQDVSQSKHNLIIVGAGPAGLFAALKAIEKGIRPIVLERGDDVDTRRKKLADISRNGILDPESNYSFGEGGAGTYSDGKLYTRSKKRGNVREVLEIFHYHGASEDILIDAHPHIGSNRLPNIIRSMRETILNNGGEVHFRTKVTSLLIKENRVIGVTTSSGRNIFGEAVILATGHSARDIYEMLNDSGIDIEAKALAIGVRLEHPQIEIDKIQYHNENGRGKFLPPAEYSFVTQVDGRGVYSFCMCPGGVVVPASTENNGQVVNGMSAASRSGRWANSGMVVEIHPGDFPEYNQYGSLAMMHLQQDLEKKFFVESNNSYNAPAQRMTDFVSGKESKTLQPTSYTAGIHASRVDLLLPPFISTRLRKGFEIFGRQRRGFLTSKAQVIGLESRTSSPVRILRTNDTLEHIKIKGLYPAGEGAGYAGGIVSAAVDGIRCIEAFYTNLNSIENNQ